MRLVYVLNMSSSLNKDIIIIIIIIIISDKMIINEALAGAPLLLLANKQDLEVLHMSRIVRKPDFCLGENKGADQLRGNREADQRLCFRYSDSTIPLLLKSEISSF